MPLMGPRLSGSTDAKAHSKVHYDKAGYCVCTCGLCIKLDGSCVCSSCECQRAGTCQSESGRCMACVPIWPDSGLFKIGPK